MKLQSVIESKLNDIREYGFKTSYINITDINGEDVKIRIGNHQGKASNNNCRTISFITEKSIERGWGYDSIVDEHVIDEDGMSDSYQDIETILEWADIDPNYNITQ